MLLHHVHEVEAHVGGHKPRHGGAKRSVLVQPTQRNALADNHRVRDNAVRELLHVVLLRLDEAELDAEVGAVDAQLHRRVDRKQIPSEDHGIVDGASIDGGEGVGEAPGCRVKVVVHQLQQCQCLEQEDVALEDGVSNTLAVVVGVDVPHVVHKRRPHEEDAVVDQGAKEPEDDEVADVGVADVLLREVHYLGPEDDVPRGKLVEQPRGVDRVQEQGAEGLVVARGEGAKELAEGQGPRRVHHVVHLQHYPEVLVVNALHLLDVVDFAVEIKGKHITLLRRTLGGDHGELGGDGLVVVEADDHAEARGKRDEVVRAVQVLRVEHLV
mmetsp:Transcript_40591/g.83030  ORF Transcript_40591/g.83030 Transcript_40591/m.83030 type:complete len:326 (+) Transcript_40591:293-1270(+)